MQPTLSPELRLVCKIIQSEGPYAIDGLDTKAIIHLLKRHRLLPLSERLIPQLSTKQQDELKRAQKGAAMKSLTLLSELENLYRKFRKESIEILPLKGPLLSTELYGDPGKRQIRDLDIFLERKHLKRASGIMADLGYIRQLPPPHWEDEKVEHYLRSRYDISFQHPDTGNLVEMHVALAYPGFYKGLEGIITERSQVVKTERLSLPFLSRDAAFLYLAVHGAHHLYYRLYWLRDLDAAMGNWDLDHQQLYSRAHEMGLERVIGVSLQLSSALLGTELPMVWEDWAGRNRRLVSRMLRRCLKVIGSEQILHPYSRLQILLFTLELRKGLAYKWKVVSSLYARKRAGSI